MDIVVEQIGDDWSRMLWSFDVRMENGIEIWFTAVEHQIWTGTDFVTYRGWPSRAFSSMPKPTAIPPEVMRDAIDIIVGSTVLQGRMVEWFRGVTEDS